MEQTDFLNKHVFIGLKNLNKAKDELACFSEADFAVVLERVEHFGIGIYTIESSLKGKVVGVIKHEEHKKKATNSKWYNKAYLTAKTRQAGLSFAATYKVSAKLLAKEIIEE